MIAFSSIAIVPSETFRARAGAPTVASPDPPPAPGAEAARFVAPRPVAPSPPQAARCYPIMRRGQRSAGFSATLRRPSASRMTISRDAIGAGRVRVSAPRGSKNPHVNPFRPKGINATATGRY
jgi:hypothetical protein